MERIKRLEINKNDDELFVDILENDYNFIEDTIYDERIAKKILQVIDEGLPQVKMIKKIYRNNELVDTIESDDEVEVYKEVIHILFAKETKKATRTKLNYSSYHLISATEFFKVGDVVLKYVYEFEGVRL